MYVSQYTGGDYGGLDVTVLSMGSDTYSSHILQSIAKVTGGFFQRSDAEGSWEEVQDPHSGSAKFVVQDYIIKNALTTSKGLIATLGKALDEDRQLLEDFKARHGIND